MSRSVKRKHLIWIQLEGVSRLSESARTAENAISKLNFKFVEFKDMLCPAPSTIMSAAGLLTGVSPVYLARNHMPKSERVPKEWQMQGYTTLPDFLERQAYHITSLHDLKTSFKSIPMFGDTHIGVTSDMKESPVAKNWWDRGVIYRRFENIKENIRGKLNACFFHIRDEEDFKRIPELFDNFASIGIDATNSVVVFIGDHGSPKKYTEFNKMYGAITRFISHKYGIEITPNFWHDTQLCEHNLNVIGYISDPSIKKTCIKTELVSGTDLAKTVLSLLGFDSENAFPKSTGIDLSDYLKENKKIPSRIVRIDNRYIEQRLCKAVALLDDKYRYVFRYDSSFDYFPFYKYEVDEIPLREELYERKKDINERHNLIFSEVHQEIVKKFRNFMIETEDMLYEHFDYNDKKCGLLFEESKKIPPYFGNEKIRDICLRAFFLNAKKSGQQKVAFYGAGEHTRKIVESDSLPKEKIVGVFTDSEEGTSKFGLPLLKTSEASKYDFDVLLISSIYESILADRAKEWLPKGKKILPLYSNFGEVLLQKIFNSVVNAKGRFLFEKVVSTIDLVFQPTDTLIVSSKDTCVKGLISLLAKNYMLIQKDTKVDGVVQINFSKANRVSHNLFRNDDDFSFEQLQDIINLTYGGERFDCVVLDIEDNPYDLMSCLSNMQKLLFLGGLVIIALNNNCSRGIWNKFKKKHRHRFAAIEYQDYAIAIKLQH